MNLSANALSKLGSRSEERANKVLSLIEDLTELEELEKRADLKTAHDSMAESCEDIASAFRAKRTITFGGLDDSGLRMGR